MIALEKKYNSPWFEWKLVLNDSAKPVETLSSKMAEFTNNHYGVHFFRARMSLKGKYLSREKEKKLKTILNSIIYLLVSRPPFLIREISIQPNSYKAILNFDFILPVWMLQIYLCFPDFPLCSSLCPENRIQKLHKKQTQAWKHTSKRGIKNSQWIV